MKKKRKLNKRGKRFVKILLITIVIIIGFVMLNTMKPKEAKQEQAEEIKEIKEIKEEVVEKKLNILDLKSNTRPYAVMINNISTVWGYQSGLQDAYLVYEIIVEGGYTRLMAIYKDKSLDRIGSVRSSRHYFLDYALENDAIYVHFGWSSQAENDIKTFGVNNINFLSYNGYIRDRSLGLSSEHTAFTDTSKIMEGSNYYGYRITTDSKPLLNYSVDEIDLSEYDGATIANKVNITFSSSRSTTFEYNTEKKVYYRIQNQVPHNDYVTKEQYSVKNIITYQVNNYTIDGDNKNRQTIENIGNGTGWYISNGYAVPITWEKTDRSSQTVYKYVNGNELVVNDGNTHIEIQPMNQIFSME